MNFKVVLTSFLAVFIAELADKTQLVGMALASKTAQPYSVMAGAMLAFALSTAISVMVGTMISGYINPDHMRYGAAVLFIIIGALMLLDWI